MRSYTWPPVEARKIIAGSKTQFRPLAVLPALVAGGKGLSVVGDGRPVAGVMGRWETTCTDPDHGEVELFAPYRPGQRLSIVADWRTLRQYDKVRPSRLPKSAPIVLADEDDQAPDLGRVRGWETLPEARPFAVIEVFDVRLQRVYDITHDDAMAEGWPPSPQGQFPTSFPVTDFLTAWDVWYSRVRNQLPYGANPLVWAITFALVEKP